MGNVFRLFFFYLNAISADIVIAACCLFLTINTLLGIESKMELMVLLVFGTFIVYWFDHYIDIQIYGKNTSPRHFFFSEYQKVFLFISVLFLITGSVICYQYLNTDEVIQGLLLGIFMLIYLFLHKKLNKYLLFKKEFLISLLYGLSVSFQGFCVWSYELLIYFIPLVFTVFYAVNTVATIEKKMDDVLGIVNNQNQAQKVLVELFNLGFIPLFTILFYLLANQIIVQVYFLCLLSIQLIHLFLLKKFKRGTLISFTYRIISEWSFCIPILVYFIKKGLLN